MSRTRSSAPTGRTEARQGADDSNSLWGTFTDSEKLTKASARNRNELQYIGVFRFLGAGTKDMGFRVGQG